MNTFDLRIDHMLKVLDESYLIYTADPTLRGTDGNGGCYYETKDGKKCSVGRCMLPSVVGRHLGGNVEDLVDEREDMLEVKSLDPMLQKKYRGLPLKFWYELQGWHDNDTVWYPESKYPVGAEGVVWGRVGFKGVYRTYIELRDKIVAGEFC